MRRAFVIFLILLFPLNVFALSMSVSSIGQARATEHATLSAAAIVADVADVTAGAPELTAMGDLDPDEPPSGMDFHDSVSGEGQVRPAFQPDGSVCFHLPSRRGLGPFPPIKPPPVR